ncbi:ArsR/SmtB family transcription factor [Psychrobacter sp.]|uniref:ArsR/SmtB family transcription factor n=1 Tax=Psychrobacter sp. TaxID=56811 RepID=UPI002648815F|nr:metalloregulator ArsR/SmtB family transcription factor [Psychrobacter sp.]MDN6308703.1 metalloregulator ArsR/SmtB family transcription factor [Psychrobacter sp.]
MSDTSFNTRPIDLFKVLSDSTRLKIFKILFNKEARCVGELVEILDQPQPTISRHLNHLKKMGILSCVRDGTWMWYTVAEDIPAWCQSILDITDEQTVLDSEMNLLSLAEAEEAIS